VTKKVNNSEDLVNMTVEQVMEWGEEMARKGMYDSNTSRLFRTGLRSLVSIMDDTEAKDPKSLLDNVESLAERWARATKANPGTMKSYKQRASALLSDFIAYMENPAGFKGRGGSAGPKKEKPEKKDEKRTAGSSTPTAASEEAAGFGSAWNTFRLPNGKVIRYSLPEDFTIEDLRRYVYHLLPATSDFDPMRPGGGLATMPTALNPNESSLS